MFLEFVQRVAPVLLSICSANSTPIKRPRLVSVQGMPAPVERAMGYTGEPVRRAERKVGRNEPCTCGSGTKFKNCCG